MCCEPPTPLLTAKIITHSDRRNGHRNRLDSGRCGQFIHLGEIAHNVFRQCVPSKIVRSAENHHMRRLVCKNSQPKPLRHFTGQFTADAAHRHAYGRPCQFLQEPPVRRLDAVRIVGSGRLKPCRQTVPKTHNVTRRHHQDEADSTGLATGFTIPSCPQLKEGRIPRSFFDKRLVHPHYS